MPDESDRGWLRPRLAALLGAPGGGSFAREDLFSSWTAFLEHLAEDATVVLVVDDAEHADEGLLDFLDHLLSSAQAPIFVLALARPELLARRPALGGRRTTVVRLDPLDDAAMAAWSTVWWPVFRRPRGRLSWPVPRGSRCSRSRRCAR